MVKRILMPVDRSPRADAVAAIKPLWIEDGLPVMYSDTWKSFRNSSPVRVMDIAEVLAEKIV